MNIIKDIPKPGESLVHEPLGTFKQLPFDKIYIPEEKINEGAFGVIYKSHHAVKTQESFAVKVQERCGESDDAEVLQEVSILRELKNVPNVIRLVDFYMDDHNMYIVQELAKGGDVLDRITSKEKYTENDARELVRTLLITLQSLHNRKIVHRDLKVENLLLMDEDDDTRMCLCDFGYAKILPAEIEGGLSTFIGTPEYVAPELIEGKKYREEVDMWSVGCIIYILLNGTLPFGENDDPRQLFQRITTIDYDFDDKSWELVSESAKKLISNLLEADQQKRLTASEALDCDWFTKTQSSKLKQTNLRESLSRIKLRQSMIPRISSKDEILQALSHLSLDCPEEWSDSDSDSDIECDKVEKATSAESDNHSPNCVAKMRVSKKKNADSKTSKKTKKKKKTASSTEKDVSETTTKAKSKKKTAASATSKNNKSKKKNATDPSEISETKKAPKKKTVKKDAVDSKTCEDTDKKENGKASRSKSPKKEKKAKKSSPVEDSEPAAKKEKAKKKKNTASDTTSKLEKLDEKKKKSKKKDDTTN